jgi:hypothetical protein
MEWFFIEAALALLIAAVIVAWTMWPQRRKPRGSAGGDSAGDSR